MARLGSPVVYTAHAEHRVETVKGEKKLQGSLHHPELVEFAGFVVRVHANKTYDIVIFPPGRELKTVDGVKEGKGDHEFRVVGAPAAED